MRFNIEPETQPDCLILASHFQNQTLGSIVKVHPCPILASGSQADGRALQGSPLVDHDDMHVIFLCATA